jgi:hypothetical protein
MRKLLIIVVILCVAFGFTTFRKATSKPFISDEVFLEWAKSNLSEISIENIPKTGFEPLTFPHRWHGEETSKPTAYYKGKINWDETGLALLRIGAANFESKLWINGKQAGYNIGGYLPFDFDITSFLKKGENDVILGVKNITAVAKGRLDPMNPSKDMEQTLLYPVGSSGRICGMYLPSKLSLLPKTHIKKSYITTSVRNHTIKADVVATSFDLNDGDKLFLYCHVENLDGLKAFDFEPVEMEIKRTAGYATVQAVWPSPKLWSPESPNLYRFVAKLWKDGKYLYEKSERFGFREFWSIGSDFYLNGTKIFLRAVSKHMATNEFWSYTPMEYAEFVVDKAKELNANILRLHANPYPEDFLELADEKGLMIVNESAAWCFGALYALENDAFWSNLRRMWETHIERDYNHPSFVIASVENELMLTGGAKRKNIEDRLANLGKYVKEISGRLIMFEGDFDPKGQADIINLHYPYEPSRHVTFPNDAYFLSETFKTDIFPVKDYKWDRKKPLYMGEFLWMPGPFHEFAVNMGDTAYSDFEKSRIQSKALFFEQYIQAMRELEVSAQNPWNPYEDVIKNQPLPSQAQKAVIENFKPVRFFVRERDARFYEDTQIQRTVTIQNWSEKPKDLKLNWNFDTQKGDWQGRLNPCESKTLTISLNIPKAGSPKKDFNFVLKLTEFITTYFEQTIVLTSYSKQKIPKTFTLLGNNVMFEENLKKLGAKFSIAQKVSDVKAGPVVITPNFLPKLTLGGSNPLTELSKKGFKFILLGPQNTQSVSFATYFDYIKTERMSLNFDFTMMGFVRDFGAWKRDEMISMFAGDNILARGGFRLSANSPAKPIACSGTGNGLLYPILELPGKGIATTYVIAQKLGSEPLCAELFNALLDYKFDLPNERLLECTNANWLKRLESMGFSPKVSQKGHKVIYLTNTELVNFDLSKMPSGSVAIVDRPDKELAKKKLNIKKLELVPAKNEGMINLTLTSLTSSLPRGEIASSCAISQNHNQGGWKSLTPMGKVNILALEIDNAIIEKLVDGYLYKIAYKNRQIVILNLLDWDNAQNNPLSILLQNMGVRGNADWATINIPFSEITVDKPNMCDGSRILFMANGKASFKVTVGKDIKAKLHVEAFQQKAGDKNALMGISIDGKKVNTFEVVATAPLIYTTNIDLKKGQHNINLTFENDFYNPPYDRNLYVLRISLTE